MTGDLIFTQSCGSCQSCLTDSLLQPGSLLAMKRCVEDVALKEGQVLSGEDKASAQVCQRTSSSEEIAGQTFTQHVCGELQQSQLIVAPLQSRRCTEVVTLKEHFTSPVQIGCRLVFDRCSSTNMSFKNCVCFFENDDILSRLILDVRVLLSHSGQSRFLLPVRGLRYRRHIL